ncbi:hypothetical protein EON63_19835 [archaeon]|nr:MAG: hypothetical protein EON63_19835 [archaeon]
MKGTLELKEDLSVSLRPVAEKLLRDKVLRSRNSIQTLINTGNKHVVFKNDFNDVSHTRTHMHIHVHIHVHAHILMPTHSCPYPCIHIRHTGA